MRARYYNPDIKRFINQDVVEGNITNSPSLNRYAYCQGDPVSLLDPFRLSPQINLDWSGIGHGVLSLLGIIPTVGSAFDLINAAWYFSEGEYGEAALFPDGMETVPKRFAISKRNDWMIKNSDIAVCYVWKITGGAAKFKQKAKKNGLKIIDVQ